jgi:hypothetical protein
MRPCAEGKRDGTVFDARLTKERRKEYGGKREVEDRCGCAGGIKEQDTALQQLRE